MTNPGNSAGKSCGGQPSNPNSPQNDSDSINQQITQTPTRRRFEVGGSSSSSPLATTPTTSSTTTVGTTTRVTTTTPMNPIMPQVVPGGSEEADESRGKRQRSDTDQGETSSRVQRVRTVVEAPSVLAQPLCPVCEKLFTSWKAYFGHLRGHPERPWRGAFPPPKGGDCSPKKDSDEQQENLKHQLAPTLYNIAKDALGKMMQDPNAAVGSCSGCVRPNIDLNVCPQDVAGPSSPPPPSPETGTTIGFDLNLPPPQEDDSDGGSDDNPPGNNERRRQ